MTVLPLDLAKEGSMGEGDKTPSPEDDDVHEGRQLLEFSSHRVRDESKQDEHISHSTSPRPPKGCSLFSLL